MPRYTTTVAHELGKDEALARLQAVTAQARAVSDLQGVWEAGTFDFSVTAQGLRLSGRVTVEDDRLTFDGKLPLIAMPFRNWIPRVLKKSLQRGIATEAETSEVIEPAGPTVLFLHIPKAGGQTLGEFVFTHTRAETAAENDVLVSGVAYLNYGFLKEQPLAVPEHVLALLRRRDLRAVIGHFWFGLHEHVARPSVYVTALRDPVERVVSLYYYTRLQDSSLSLDAFVAEPPFREVDNDQTRRIAGEDPEIGECTPALLEKAKENLRNHFAVAGTIERLPDTLTLLRRRLGWSGDVEVQARNVNADRPPLSSLPRSTVEAIRKRSELDVELWRYASELLDEAVRQA